MVDLPIPGSHRDTGTALRLPVPSAKPVTAEERPLAAPAVLEELILTGSSTIVFQALQAGHCPVHLADSYPHS